MCAGGGGGVSKASITDPLQYTSQYTKAKQKVEQVQSRKGKLDDAKYQTKLNKAKAELAKADKYKDGKANSVEKNVDFFSGKIDALLNDSNKYSLHQQLVNASNEGLQQTLSTLNQMASLAAENQQLLQQDATRMAALIGPPPPEQSASAPIIGANREDGVRPGRTRRSLRIDRAGDSALFI